jgi:hypothetical protein
MKMTFMHLPYSLSMRTFVTMKMTFMHLPYPLSMRTFVTMKMMFMHLPYSLSMRTFVTMKMTFMHLPYSLSMRTFVTINRYRENTYSTTCRRPTATSARASECACMHASYVQVELREMGTGRRW